MISKFVYKRCCAEPWQDSFLAMSLEGAYRVVNGKVILKNNSEFPGTEAEFLMQGNKKDRARAVALLEEEAIKAKLFAKKAEAAALASEEKARAAALKVEEVKAAALKAEQKAQALAIEAEKAMTAVIAADDAVFAASLELEGEAGQGAGVDSSKPVFMKPKQTRAAGNAWAKPLPHLRVSQKKARVWKGPFINTLIVYDLKHGHRKVMEQTADIKNVSDEGNDCALNVLIETCAGGLNKKEARKSLAERVDKMSKENFMALYLDKFDEMPSGNDAQDRQRVKHNYCNCGYLTNADVASLRGLYPCSVLFSQMVGEEIPLIRLIDMFDRKDEGNQQAILMVLNKEGNHWMIGVVKGKTMSAEIYQMGKAFKAACR